jgi:hypothetical protein
MKTRVVEYKDGEREIRLVVSEANVLVGMRRAVLGGTAAAYMKARTEPDEEGEAATLSRLEATALGMTVSWLYPMVVAATVEAEGLDVDGLGVEEFIALPEPLTNAWSDAVLDLNPHWAVSQKDEGEAEKKGGKPSSETSAGA